MRNRICFFLLLVALVVPAGAQTTSDTITVDASAPSHPFPHFWEQMFGSGRAVLSLRDSYRRDLNEVRQTTGLQYVRFHGILNDDVGIYGEDKHGNPVYNFSYVDQIYDGLLAAHVKPFVELSFMPYKLAGSQMLQSFWYHPNVSPPKDYAIWDDMITQFVKHLVSRYGEEEVASWYFEVWNEPNLDFWVGAPRQKSYFELYDHTARAVKSVSPRLRVGGPATAQAAWIPDMIKHADKVHVPLDFVSTHVYGNDTADNVLGTNEQIARDQMVCRAVKKVNQEIKASAHPEMPLIWSEYNAAYDNDVAVTDSVYMGPWLATTIAQCDGLTNMMSLWTFSDVFEEQGVVKTPFYGGFGLIAAGNIPKASFYAMELLHNLGDQRIETANPNILVTKAKEGALVIAVWNIVNPGSTGTARSLTLQFKKVKPSAQVSINRVDQAHGDTLTLWQKMGSPQYPTQSQMEQLRKQSQLAPPEVTKLTSGSLTVQLPVNGLAVLEIR